MWEELLMNIVPMEILEDRDAFMQSFTESGKDINERICGYTMLSFAAECGNLEIVKFLIENGADINVKNSNGSIPLHIAANCGHKDVVEHFLNSGNFVDSRDNNNCTPVHYVVGKYLRQAKKSPEKERHLRELGCLFDTILNDTQIFLTFNDRDLEVARFLFSKGADLDAINDDGCTPLLLAARHSFNDAFKFLIKSGAKVDGSDNEHFTVLHYASKSGWLEVVHSLVDLGCDIDAKTAYGSTPLLLAAQHSHKDVVQLLIELGADFECCDADGWTLLHSASYYGWLTVVEFQINKKCDLNPKTSLCITPVFLAVCNSHQDIVTLLFESGANEYCDANEWMVLHYASHEGWLEVVATLVKRGCDVDAETADGETPLLIAAKQSHISVVRLLIESGANIELADEGKWTALHHASQRGSLQVVKLLLRKGYNVNVETSLGFTPVLLAADNLHREVVDLLVAYGANVKCSDCKKWTLLHYASRNEWVDLVKYLVDKGCDVNVETSLGDTPLYIACLVQQLEIMKYLLEAGADFNVQNYIGDTAFNFCILNSASEDTIKLFINNGAYFEPKNYVEAESKYKENILQDIKVCTQAIINKFDNKDLPAIYKLYKSVESLPSIDDLKIVNNKSKVQEIQQSVEYDIKTNGFCNVLKARPLVLRVLCVESIKKNINETVFFKLF